MSRDERGKNMGGVEQAMSLLGGSALTLAGLRRGSLGGLMVAAGGAFLAYRGATGRCPVYRRFGISTTRDSYRRGVTVRRAMTIRRSADDIYSLIRNFQALPAMVHRIDSIDDLGGGSYHWKIKESRTTIDIITELTAEEPGRRLAWRTLPESKVRCDGEITLTPAPGERGTELHLTMHVAAPGGAMTMVLAPLMRRLARFQLGETFHAVKQLLETGEVATNATRPERERVAQGLQEPMPAVPTTTPSRPAEVR